MPAPDTPVTPTPLVTRSGSIHDPPVTKRSRCLGRTQLCCCALLAGVLLSSACDKVGGGGQLTREQCVQMVLRLNQLRDKELGRASSVKQRNTVDGCMQHGTKAQFDCVQFASNASEVARCDELAK